MYEGNKNSLWKKIYKSRTTIITSAILLVALTVVLLPIIWATTLSFDKYAIANLPEFSFIPGEFTLNSYRYIFEMFDLTRYFVNTIVICGLSTMIAVFFALICGYAFAKGQFVGKKFCYIYMLVVLVIPFESYMIPLYKMFHGWNMINTYWPILLLNFSYVYGIFFARQNIETIPDSLRESAKMDGAGEWKIFFRIILPLSKPTAATLGILKFVGEWNSLLWPMIVLRDEEKRLISNAIAYFNEMQKKTYYGPRMSLALVCAVPLVTLYLFLQKYIVQSVALSGVKQ